MNKRLRIAGALGAGLAVYMLARPGRPRPGDGPATRVFPLPRMAYDGRRAQISSGHKSRNPARPNHDGVDIMYPRYPSDPDWPVGDGEGIRTKEWIVPAGTPALATEAGVVARAGWTPTGYRVWVDHGRYQTGYFHLASLWVRKGQKVRAGEALGLVGDNPSDVDARHLHFELTRFDRYQPLDPTVYLDGASVQ